MMNEETCEVKKSTIYLSEVERLAQDILTDRKTKLELSNAQNKFREAHRALQQTSEKRMWMKLGSVYVELATEECKSIVKNDLEKVEQVINNLHESIKNKVYTLRDLEHQPGIEGFRLKPMTSAEAKAIYKGFGLD